MKIKISITTPKGHAKRTDKNMRGFIIGFKKLDKLDVYINDEDTEIVWDIEGHPRPLMKIVRNVNLFHVTASKVIESKRVQKGARKKGYTDEQIEQVKDMLESGTKVTVVKEATAQEMVEANMSWWQRVKEKFHKTE